jgi:catalase
MPSKQVFSTQDTGVYTTSNGAPVSEPYAAQRAGVQGALLLQGK